MFIVIAYVAGVVYQEVVLTSHAEMWEEAKALAGILKAGDFADWSVVAIDRRRIA